MVILLLLLNGEPDTERMTYVMMYEKGRIVVSRSSNTGKIELPDRDYDYIRVVQTKDTFTVFDKEYYNPAPSILQRLDHYPKGN